MTNSPSTEAFLKSTDKVRERWQETTARKENLIEVHIPLIAKIDAYIDQIHEALHKATERDRQPEESPAPRDTKDPLEEIYEEWETESMKNIKIFRAAGDTFKNSIAIREESQIGEYPEEPKKLEDTLKKLDQSRKDTIYAINELLSANPPMENFYRLRAKIENIRFTVLRVSNLRMADELYAGWQKDNFHKEELLKIGIENSVTLDRTIDNTKYELYEARENLRQPEEIR